MLLLIALVAPAHGDGPGFQSASSVEEVRRFIAALPDDDWWLTVTGDSMAWLHKNVHRVLPTVNVYREGPVRPLQRRERAEIGSALVTTGKGQISFEDFLSSDQSTVMGIVMLHQGHIVYERYPRQLAYEKPIYWSVSKVLVSAVVSIFEDRGHIDLEQAIETYLPKLAGSSFAGVTVRNILDMATGLDCPEDYENRSSCYYTYSKTVGEGYFTPTDPDNPYVFASALDVGRFAEQGTSYSYSGLNTFILGWLVEEIAGMPFQDVFSREIWQLIGAEGDASFLAPRFGVPIMHGGFMARLRDLARFGLLYTPSHDVVADRRIISKRHVDAIATQGNPELLRNARNGSGLPPGVKHNGFQWGLVYDNNDFFKGGWGGQGLLVNPELDLVVAYSGYFRDDRSETDPLPLIRQVLQQVFMLAGGAGDHGS